MKQIIIFLLVIIVVLIGFGKYSQYKRFNSPEIDYKTEKKIDFQYHNQAFLFGYYDAIEKAVKAGIVVCRATRCVAGRVVLEDEVDDAKLGTIVSDDLNPQKARILLMLGLAKTKDKKVLQSYFMEY